MHNRSEVRDFLVSRRAKVTPAQVGLATDGRTRRVPGLRRDEVAERAGVSVEYYTQLERGNIRGASESVLDALARALLLDDAERTHLFDLARAANTTTAVRQRPAGRRVRPAIQAILDSQLSPAWVSNTLGDVVATNTLGRAYLSPLFDDPARPVNTARFRFLNPRAVDYYLDWDQTAADTVASLRSRAGKNPYDKALTDLIGELCTRSTEFAARWAEHDVRHHRTGRKRVHHPVVGELTLSYEALELPSDEGLVLYIFTAEPESLDERALNLLASWASTPEAVPDSAQLEPEHAQESTS
ncbi:helix-turn-helix domain-containing protein [Cellulomonas endophytica]|uniref:helix-turn-helix domain-containing protein n=1 Tax=Cellulomonas endophytica TaxID=2494735 RepID=UPI001010B08D|nr:helix-turn-helix transcriptional regulator [Cellulomonas endophytica]